MRFTVYRDRKKDWRWRLKSSNGKTIADSAEGYKRKSWCLRMVLKLISDIPKAEIRVKDAE